ncbi:DUF982 domain-containing protein [Aminobacter carboxidus]
MATLPLHLDLWPVFENGLLPPRSSLLCDLGSSVRTARMDLVPAIWVRGGALSLRRISSIEEAAALLTDWPFDRRGTFYYLANQALEGLVEGSSAGARLAFENFCREAGILVDQTY